jgi:hypothetical protein
MVYAVTIETQKCQSVVEQGWMESVMQPPHNFQPQQF